MNEMERKLLLLEKNGYHINLHGDYSNLELDSNIIHKRVERMSYDDLEKLINKKKDQKGVK